MYREFEEFVYNNFDFNEGAIRRKYGSLTLLKF